MGLCVVCDMGYQIPTGYGDAMTKMPSNTYGVAVRRSPDIPALQIEHSYKQLTKEHLAKINKNFESHRVIHYLEQRPDGMPDKADLQPFRLIPSGEGGAALAAVLVGDFKKHLPPESKLSAEVWCVNSKLIPMMQRIWRLTKEDAQAFNEELKTMEGEVKDLIGLQGGLITLMLATVDDTVIHQFQRSLPTFKKFQWGTVSDTLGYATGMTSETPAKDAKPKVEDVKHKPSLVVTSASSEDDDEDEEDIGEARVAVLNTSKPAKGKETPKAAPDKEVKGKAPIIGKVSEKEVVLASGAIVRRIEHDGKIEYMFSPPMMLTQRKPLRKAYVVACGRTLSNQDIDKRVMVRITNEALLKEVQKSFTDFDVLNAPSTTGSDKERFKPAETGKETVKVQDKATGKVAEVSVTEKKTEAPLPQGPSVHEERKYPEGGSPIYAAISPVDKHFITKHLDKNSMEILDPTKDQELEDTTKQFHEEFPLIFASFEDTWRIKPEIRTLLNAKVPGAMAMWQGDLIRYCVNITKMLEQATDPAVVKTSKKKVA